MGTQRSINFCPPRPGKVPFRVRGEKVTEINLTRIHGHDEKHVGELADFVRYRRGRRVRRNCYPGLHVSLVDGVDKGDGIRCDMVSAQVDEAIAGRETDM